MTEEHVLRPRAGRILAVVVMVVCAVLAVMLVVQTPQDTVRGIPALALVAYAAWALFWAPSVRVDGDGVTLVNVFRTITIPWGRIVRIDTRYAFTLFTRRSRYAAWAAPAPGRHRLLVTDREEGKHLPESSYIAGTVRPGDLVTSDSGASAYIVRREWERRRDAGLLEESGPDTTVRIHTVTIAVSAVLVAAVVVSVLI